MSDAWVRKLETSIRATERAALRHEERHDSIEFEGGSGEEALEYPFKTRRQFEEAFWVEFPRDSKAHEARAYCSFAEGKDGKQP